MNTRILLAGIIGGIAMFLWSFVAHDLLPLGQMGIRDLANQKPILESLKTNLGTSQGLFLYPGLGLGKNPSSAEKKEAMKRAVEKTATGPSGLLLYRPQREINMGRLLGVEFFVELCEALLAAFLLAQTGLISYAARVGFVLVIGIISAIATNVPYWNWYSFPKRFTAAAIFMQVVGFLLVGLISAALIKNRNASPRPV